MGILTTNTKGGLASALGSRTGAAEIETLLGGGAGVASVLANGADPSGVQDSTTAIQGVINQVIAAGGGDVYLPPGTYKITDSLSIRHATDAGYVSVRLRGATGFLRSTVGATRILATSLTDRPAIVVQGARGVTIADLEIYGGNAAGEALYNAGQTSITEDPASYVSASYTNGQYNPQAGIAIDPYSGTKPGSNFYPGTYGSTYHSHDVIIDNVKVWNCVVGFMLKPSNDINNCEQVTLRNCLARFCAYGVSVGNSQARCVNILDTFFWSCCTMIECTTHGQQQGAPPFVRGGGGIMSYRVIRCSNAFGAFGMEGFYAETIETIGILGTGVSSQAHAASFTDCGFKFRNTSNTVDANDAPYHLVANMAVTFTGCSFNTHWGVFNAVSSGQYQVVCDGCTFANYSAITWDDLYYVGYNLNWGSPKWLMRGTSYYTDRFKETVAKWNCPDTETIVATVPSRFDLSIHSRKVHGPATSYDIETGIGASAHVQVACNASGYNWVGSTLTFTAGTAGEFQIGDLLFYKTAADAFAASTQFFTIAIQVTNVVSTTVTATALCGINYLDTTYAPSSLGIAYRPFAHGVTCTGSTNSSTSITNVASATSLFKIGDWIAGTGIPAKTRVTNVSGTTVTISKTATATADYIHLYCDHAWREDVPKDTADAFFAARDGATDDVKPIMAMLDYRGRCQLLGGSYGIASTVTTPAGSVLFGAGMQNTLLVPLSSFVGPIVTLGQRATLRDLYIDGTDVGSSIGVQFGGTSGRIERIQVIDMAKGIVFPDSIANNQVTGCRVFSCATSGIEVGGCAAPSIRDCIIDTNGIGIAGVSTSDGLLVSGCYINTSGTYGVSLTASLGSPTISNNYFTGNTTADCLVSGNVRGGMFMGNRCNSSPICFTASNGNDWNILGNTFNPSGGTTKSITITNSAATRYSIGENTYLSGAFTLSDNSGTQTRWRGLTYNTASPSTGTSVAGEVQINSAPGTTTNTPIGWICSTGGGPGTWQPFYRANPVLTGSKTFDWGSVADGAVLNTTVTVTGAALGNYAIASLSGAVTANAFMVAHVTATDTVTVTLFNKTGGNLDLASATLSCIVFQ